MDYRRFLSKLETLELPYVGGAFVHARDRRLRVAQPPPMGWHTFEVRGRDATARGPCAAPPLDDLPARRGHLVEGWLFSGGDVAARVHLLPPDEPPPLAPARARAWPSGHLLFDTLDFDGDAELAARQALEDGGAIASLKGVAASLRAAFGFATLARQSRALGVPVGALEARALALEAADGGAPRAAEIVRELEAARRAALASAETRRIAQRARAGALRGAARSQPAEARARDALDAAGAELLALRNLDGGCLEVTFRFMDERFVSVVDRETLQVFDAGICLAGEDALVTLESLPSVIREAIEEGALNITRR